MGCQYTPETHSDARSMHELCIPNNAEFLTFCWGRRVAVSGEQDEERCDLGCASIAAPVERR
jgi:hypothetical protein